MFSLSDAFIIFFVTLGPLKAIGPFAVVTRGTEAAFRRSVALRATAISTAIALGLAVLGSILLQNWKVSVVAIKITGGIIIFYQAVQMIMEPPTAAPAAQGNGPSEPTLAAALFPIAVPAIITAPGIAAIAAMASMTEGNISNQALLLGVLLLIMGLNLIALLNADVIFKHIPPAILRVIGWVMAVLQACLATQIIIRNLQALGALSKAMG